MSTLIATAAARIDAPADVVLAVLRDFDGHHRRILPPAFSSFTVHHGAHASGTMTEFRLTLGGLTTETRTVATEPEPGVIEERVIGRDMVTWFRVTPDGEGSHATIETVWTPAGGVSGLLERLLAPSMLRRVYRQELALLAIYAPDVLASGVWSVAPAA